MLAVEENKASQLKMGERKSASKVSFSAVIKHDALGTKTKWAGTMKEGNLSGKIERTPRPDGSREYNTVIVFTGSIINTDTMKERLEEEYKDDVVITAVVPSKQFKNVCISQTPGEHHRQSGSSGGSETLFELDDDEDSTQQSASFTSYSSRGSAQTYFKTALVHRDTSGAIPLCALCQSSSDVQGAHIYPVNAKRRLPFSATSLHNKYDTCNGLLLCNICHGYFDKGYWWIVVENDKYISYLSDALQGVSDIRRNQHRVCLPIDYTKKCAPDADCLRVQQEFCETSRMARHDSLQEKPFGCEICLCAKRRYTTAVGLLRHQTAKNCIAPEIPQIFSPSKAGKRKKSGRKRNLLSRGER
jgi:hypothetical protein